MFAVKRKPEVCSKTWSWVHQIEGKVIWMPNNSQNIDVRKLFPSMKEAESFIEENQHQMRRKYAYKIIDVSL